MANVESIDIRSRFNKSARVILNANDGNPDGASRDNVRSCVLSERNDLRRWVQEVYSAEIPGAPGQESDNIA
jgi:hypothetical protein